MWLISLYEEEARTDTEKEEHVKIQGEGAVYKPMKEALVETNSAYTLVSDF